MQPYLPCCEFSTLVKSYNSSEERIISFERTKTNHDIDKIPRENNSQNYIEHNLHKLSSCAFENNFREFATLNAVCEETIVLHIFVESRQEYF